MLRRCPAAAGLLLTFLFLTPGAAPQVAAQRAATVDDFLAPGYPFELVSATNVGPDCVARVRARAAQCLHRDCSRFPACPTLPEPRRRRAGHDEPGDLRKRFRRRLRAWPRAESRRVGGESDQRSDAEASERFGQPARQAERHGNWVLAATRHCRQMAVPSFLPARDRSIATGLLQVSPLRTTSTTAASRTSLPGAGTATPHGRPTAASWRSSATVAITAFVAIYDVAKKVDLVRVAECRFRHEPDVVARRNEDRVHPQAWDAVRPTGAGRFRRRRQSSGACGCARPGTGTRPGSWTRTGSRRPRKRR